jgi:hypothetical protein
MARTNLPPEQKIKMRPRNEFVLVRMTQKGESGGIAIPEVSAEGKEFHVVAVGPKVDETLQVGDQVLMVGRINDTYHEVPGCRNLILVKQENVVLVLE